MNDARVHAVIIATDSNERLWPLYRKTASHQIVSFSEDQSLLEQTVARVSSRIPIQRRWIVATMEHQEEIFDTISNKISDVIIEPEARGFASAMLLAALLLYQQDPDVVLLFLPSNHYIPQQDLFLEFVDHAVDFVTTHDAITVLGLYPTHPTSEYNYIKPHDSLEFPTQIVSFYDASDEVVAESFCQQGYLWNTGMSVVKASVLIEIAKKYAPQLYESVNDYIQGCGDYTDVPVLTAQDAFFVPNGQWTVLPAHFMWYDVGTLETYLSLKGALSPQENHIQIDAKDNLIEAQDSLVAVVGVDNLCIIQKDDILLVVHREHVEKVKQIIDTLKKEHKEEYL